MNGRTVKHGEARKPMTFRVSCVKSEVRPKFDEVVVQLYRQYEKHRSNIIGKTLKAPAGTTARQMTLALTRVREMWEKKR